MTPTPYKIRWRKSGWGYRSTRVRNGGSVQVWYRGDLCTPSGVVDRFLTVKRALAYIGEKENGK